MERHQQQKTLGSNVKIPGTELIYDYCSFENTGKIAGKTYSCHQMTQWGKGIKEFPPGSSGQQRQTFSKNERQPERK